MSLATQRRVLPGFGLSLGFTLFYVSVIVLIPLGALFAKSAEMSWSDFWAIINSRQVMAAYRLTLGASFIAAFINVFLGLLIAWVLVRYAFPMKRFVDALIDLPFALPTAVAGIALTTLYSERGWIGRWLTARGYATKERWEQSLTIQSFTYPWPDWQGFGESWWPIGVAWYKKIALAPLGVVIALMFVGLPFVVRTLQPVLQDLSREVEEASASLGATRRQTFSRVILPQLYPALLAGFALAFARGLGEYGSVIFISGNLPATQIAPQLIIEKLEEYDYAGATAVASVLLVISFILLLIINLIQRQSVARAG